MLAKNFDRVRAFEPNPAAVGILRVRLQRITFRMCRLSQSPLSDSVGRSRLYLHTEVREKTIGSSNSLIPSFGVAGQGVVT